MKTAQNYALELEMIFRKKGLTDLSADSFSIRPKEALEEGLHYLSLIGTMSANDAADFLTDYNLGEESLWAYLEQPSGDEQVAELIQRLSVICLRGEAR